MSTTPTNTQEIDGKIEQLWVDAMNQIVHMNPAEENWKSTPLPLARIKKIMKSEEGVYQELERERQEQAAIAIEGAAPPSTTGTRFMIAGEAPVLLGKACELMIREISTRAWWHTERNRRRTLQRQDVHAAVGESEVYDFLIDIVPRVAASNTGSTPKSFPPASSNAGAIAGVPGGTAAVSALPATDPGSVQTTNLSDAEMRYAQLQQIQEQTQGGSYTMSAQPSQGHGEEGDEVGNIPSPTQVLQGNVTNQHFVMPPDSSLPAATQEWGSSAM